MSPSTRAIFCELIRSCSCHVAGSDLICTSRVVSGSVFVVRNYRHVLAAQTLKERQERVVENTIWLMVHGAAVQHLATCGTRVVFATVGGYLILAQISDRLTEMISMPTFSSLIEARYPPCQSLPILRRRPSGFTYSCPINGCALDTRLAYR